MKRHQLKWGLMALFLLLSISGFSQSWRYAKGVVVDSNFQIPLAGAHVLVHPSNEGVVTDANGYFEMWLTHGEHTLLVRYPGFEERTVATIPDTMRINLRWEMGLDTVVSVDPEMGEDFRVLRNDRVLQRGAFPSSRWKPSH